MSEDRVRIRYGRVHNGNNSASPKNTLVTTRVKGAIDDLVYFGIARCNLNMGDSFRRAGVGGGRAIAESRLRLALKDSGENYDMVGSVRVHPKGLRGWVYLKDIKDLIAFFSNIDDWSQERFAPLSRNRYVRSVEAA